MEERVNDLTTEATLNVLSINRDSAVPLYFQLKEQIKNGTYNVDPMETARSMVKFMGDNEF